MTNQKEKLIAIYSRKSKLTTTGESIDNQIEMCKNYLIAKYGQHIKNNIVIFEDEGFTGANTNRPEFQKMLKEFTTKKYQMLVVYRLDRISRNISDFCTLKNQLTNLNISFISITENFDTSTPMGNAMLMISSVFAQLERDTIAERIKDNMYELAKTGRWLGGTTPLGYISQKIETITIDNKKRNLYQLTFDEQEILKTKLIFSKYQELKTLSKLQDYLYKNNIKTRKNKYFSRFALKEILTNLVYCQADQDIKNYLQSQNIPIYNNTIPSNHLGLITYNKRYQKKNSNNKISKNNFKNINQWIIAIGKHQGIISGQEWIKIQNQLKYQSKNKRQMKKNHQTNATLSGILKCPDCHSNMRPKALTTIINNQKNFSYICELKSKSKKQKCTTQNLNGPLLENTISNIIQKLPTNTKIIKHILKQFIINQNYHQDEISILKNTLKTNQQKQKKLINKLALLDQQFIPLINEELKNIETQNQEIITKIKNITLNKQNNQDLTNQITTIITNPFQNYHNLDINLKRKIINILFSNITIKNNKLHIQLQNKINK